MLKKDFVNLVRVEIASGLERHAASGTLIGKRHLRMVELDEFFLDAIPEGNLLVTRHKDQPGMMGRIGTILGDAGVNIAASLHFVAALPNTHYFEYCVEQGPLRQTLTKQKFPVIDGDISVPEEPVHSEFTAITRPSMSEGVRSCTSDWRITTLTAVMKEVTEYNNAVASKDAFDAWRAIKASGKTEVVVPTEAERKAWMSAMAPVQDAMAPRVGKDLVVAIRAAVAGIPAK